MRKNLQQTRKEAGLTQQEMTFKGNAFWVLYEMARCVCEGVEWDKGAQITLRYDPRSNRAKLTVSRFPDESAPQESQEPSR